MQINSISSMGFRSSKSIDKTVDAVANAANSISKRTGLFTDSATSLGADCFVTKNIKGETVKIYGLSDVAKAAGIVFDEQPETVSKATDNFISTPYGKIRCMEDAVNISRKLKG